MSTGPKGRRRKHPNKDLEVILQTAEGRTWRVEVAKGGYFKLMCPCPDKHMRWVHLTPSNPNYGKDLTKWLGRQSCWKKK